MGGSCDGLRHTSKHHQIEETMLPVAIKPCVSRLRKDEAGDTPERRGLFKMVYSAVMMRNWSGVVFKSGRIAKKYREFFM